MKTYLCNKCKKEFEAKGRKMDFVDPIYGNSWKYVATCPSCGEDISEFKKPMISTGDSSQSCPTGTCPFAN